MKRAESFINKLVEDRELQLALGVAAQAAVTKEEKIAVTTKFANEAGFEVSSDELQKFVENMQNTSNILSDDDLDNVAGGYSDTGALVGEASGAGLGAAGGTAAGGALGGPVGAAGGGAAGAVLGGAGGKYVGGEYGDDIASGTTVAAKTVASGATSAGNAVADGAKKAFSGW